MLTKNPSRAPRSKNRPKPPTQPQSDKPSLACGYARWLARMLRDWHGRRAQRLTLAAEKQRKELDRLTEKAAHHIHRAKHWDLISNRRHR